MPSEKPTQYKLLLILLITNLLALVLKLFVASLGYTYDLESYLIVSDLVNAGKNVYSETSRYNYGPAWFLILGLVRSIWEDPKTFHIALVTLLSIGDIAISYYLSKKISLKAGIAFALNPISIIITGYYVQFDTLAILIGLLALDNISVNTEHKSVPKLLIGSTLLGLSLCLKHVLIFLPICLLLKKIRTGSEFKTAVTIPFVSYFVFLVCFLPFLNGQNSTLILNNVFLYQSVHNVGLLRGLAESLSLTSSNLVFIYTFILLSGSLIAAWYCYRLSAINFLAIHLAVIFCLLPGMAPQYLVYLLPIWLCQIRNIYFWLAILVGTLLLIAISPGLQVTWLDHRFFRLAMIQLLVLAGLGSMALKVVENKSRA